MCDLYKDDRLALKKIGYFNFIQLEGKIYKTKGILLLQPENSIEKQTNEQRTKKKTIYLNTWFCYLL